MTTKLWKVDATQEGKCFELFTKTTDEMVSFDLTLGAHGSLVLSWHPHHPATEHRDLARGAFKAHTRLKPVSFGEVTEATEAEFPTGEPNSSVGGVGDKYLMSIWRKEK